MSKTTFTIIAYDTPNDKRRYKIHKLLQGYGTWTQYSLFECFLTAKEWVKLKHELKSLMDDKEDNVRMYRLCAGCREKVETIGRSKPTEDTVFLV